MQALFSCNRFFCYELYLKCIVQYEHKRDCVVVFISLSCHFYLTLTFVSPFFPCCLKNGLDNLELFGHFAMYFINPYLI